MIFIYNFWVFLFHILVVFTNKGEIKGWPSNPTFKSIHPPKKIFFSPLVVMFSDYF